MPSYGLEAAKVGIGGGEINNLMREEWGLPLSFILPAPLDPFGPFLLSVLRFRDCQSLPTLLCSGLHFPEIADYLQPCPAQTSAPPRLRRMP